MATDYDALASELENAEPFAFSLRGQEFALRPAASMEWHQQLALVEADSRQSIKLILGDDEYARLDALTFPAGVLERIITDWLEWQGLKPGESPAS